MTVKTHIGKMALLLLLLICMAKLLMAEGTASNHRLQLMPEDSLDKKTAEQMEETENDSEEPSVFAAWNEKKNKTVENTDLNRSTKANVMTVSGDTGLLFQHSGYLDTQGDHCLIDEQTAYELFGGTEVEGQAVTVEDRDYTVQGMITGVEGVVAIPANTDMGEIFNRITLEIPDGKYAQGVQEEFTLKHGISADSMDYGVYRSWTRFLVWLIPGIMGICLLVSICREGWKQRKYPVICGMYGVFFGTVLLLLIWVLQIDVSIPAEFIPNQWSDFDFFTAVYETKREELSLLFQTEKSIPELVLINPVLTVLKYIPVFLVLFLLFHRKLRIENGKALCAYLVFSWVSVFGIILALRGGENASVLSESRMLWLFMACYLVIRYILEIFRCSYFANQPEDAPYKRN